ncbi:unnamed protein product [Phytomonas sp. EM1]|nr:unnamed protein product [Phytomonas sp. EM1]|eukprot:CCW64134.1 unnamed protein product [Phytomonas sp. isolate EM1]
MFGRVLPRRGFHLVRQVDTRGFVGDFRKLNHVRSASTMKEVRAALGMSQNVLFCGHYSTGKLTILKALGEHCEKKLGKRVAFVSADVRRASRLDGYLLHHFIGLRLSQDDLPSQEQLEGTLERHMRLVESTYAGNFPSLSNTDVLILDSLERIPSVVLLSMDAVSRRQRGKLREPFGGLRVFAAADFWRLPVHPTSDTGDYLFQLDSWGEMFPKQVLLERTHGQEKRLNDFTLKALYGNLDLEDIKELEALSTDGNSSQSGAAEKVCNEAVSSTTSDIGDDPDAPFELNATTPTHSNVLSSPEDVNCARQESSHQWDGIISNAEAIVRFMPRFPKQPSVKIMPSRYRQLKRIEIGNFLVNILAQSTTAVSLGLFDALSVEPGSKVHLLLDGQASYGVPAGAVGEVMGLKEHYITVHFPEEHRTIEIPRMRITTFHPQYPEITYELRQFPLFPRHCLCPMSILMYGNSYHVNLNGRQMADTNDVGNLLAQMRSFKDFTLRNIQDFLQLDGMVHEPTRIYYHLIKGLPMTSTPEQWCRNCKSFVPSSTFFSHWNDCIKSVRWCSECNRSIPLELLEPHREKHQVVMCLDCGQAVEWRQWEAHRLSCWGMMREVSPDNEFLPLRTRQLALELGLDKRDLHTVRSFSRTMLPRSKVRME